MYAHKKFFFLLDRPPATGRQINNVLQLSMRPWDFVHSACVRVYGNWTSQEVNAHPAALVLSASEWRHRMLRRCWSRDVLSFSWRHPSFGPVRFSGIQLLRPPDVGRRVLGTRGWHFAWRRINITTTSTHRPLLNFRRLIITKSDRQDSDLFSRLVEATGRNRSSPSSFHPSFSSFPSPSCNSATGVLAST